MPVAQAAAAGVGLPGAAGPLWASGASVAVTPDGLWQAWNPDPLVVVLLGLATWCYARGTTSIWRQVGRGRVVRPARTVAWGAAVTTLAVALLSPVEAIAHALLAGHMVQHVLLTLVAAPLLVLASPTLPLLRGLPHRLRRRAARLHARGAALRRAAGTGPWVLGVAAVYGVTLVAWHLPAAYEGALAHVLLHAVEHAMLLGASVLLWWTVFESGRRSAFGYGTGIALVFVAGLVHVGLGAVLSLAPAALYPAYADGAAAWGMTPVGDQQLGGVLMWAPSKLLHGAVVAVLAVAWLRDVEARTRRRQAGTPVP